MGYTVNKNGELIGDDGQPVKIGETVVKLDIKSLDQGLLDGVVKSRLERAGKETQARITQLEQELQTEQNSGVREELQVRIDELTKQITTVEQQTAKKSQDKIKSLEDENILLKKTYNDTANEFKSYRIRTDLISEAAKAKYIDPEDAVLRLASMAEFDEKDPGIVKYKLKVKEPDTDKEVIKYMTSEEAVRHLGTLNPRYVRGANTTGSGQNFEDNLPAENGDTAKMTAEQRLTHAYSHSQPAAVK